jgi:peptidoglycan/LPS O-acetylase OafA/YrhL
MRDLSRLTLFVSGVLTMGYAIAALFFAKFWRRTRARLFAWFAAAFLLLAVQRAALATLAEPGSAAARWSYALRLLAFLLILAGIVEQNRRAPGVADEVTGRGARR